MELLAPARDLDTLKAAFDAGADAVYLGLKDFSARKGAKNFTFQDFLEAQQIKKTLNKKLYVALNTLIFQNEIPLLLDTLAFLSSVETDAIIIQDYGIYEIVNSLGLKIPLHASTQMGTKNHIQINFLKKLGFKRVVLERQLTLSEISDIKKLSNIELEVFVHGAMCFSLSGYCFFSKSFSVRSGNRGDCSQPCRWLFADKISKKHPFSMLDLEALSVLPALDKLGIDSIKIEGRMKGVDYVYPVVQAYRNAIDLIKNGKLDVLNTQHLSEIIQKSTLSRKSTTGFFFFPKNSKKLVDINESGTGLPLGKVATVFKNSIFFKTSSELSVGDTIRIDDKDTEQRIKLPVKALYFNNQKLSKVSAGSYIGIPINQIKIKAGSKIYLVHKRSSYKPSTSIKIEKQNPPVYKEKSDYLKMCFNDILKSTPTFSSKIKKLYFNPEKFIYSIQDMGDFYFIPPTIYESKLDIYKELNNTQLDGALVSQPAEATINQNILISGSFFLYATNIFAIKFFSKLGFKALSISPDSYGIFNEIKQFFPLWLEWKNIPLCVSRVPMENCRYRLTSKKHTEIDVKYFNGDTYLFLS